MNIENKYILVSCKNDKKRISGVMTWDLAKEKAEEYFPEDYSIIAIMKVDKETRENITLARKENGQWIDFE